MTRLNAVLRRDSLRCLKGRWGKGVAGTLFLFSAWLVILLLEHFCLTALGILAPDSVQVPFLGVTIAPAQAAVSGGFILLTFLTMAPLITGLQKWYYRLAGGPTPDLRMIFDYLSGFRLYCKAVLLWLTVILRTVIFGAVCALAPVGIRFARQAVGRIGTPASAVGEALLFVLFVITAVLAAVLTLCFALRYFLAPYYFAENEQLSVREALRRSVRAMKRMQGQVFTLILGWLPFWISCIFLVPLIFMVPYCSAALAINARYLMGREVRRDAQQEGAPGDTIVF